MWHDTKIMDFIEGQNEYPLGELNENGTGMFDISVKTLKKLLKSKSVSLEDYQREAIQSDIAFAKAQGDECVLYECF